jgi:hypothetical protein
MFKNHYRKTMHNYKENNKFLIEHARSKRLDYIPKNENQRKTARYGNDIKNAPGLN